MDPGGAGELLLPTCEGAGVVPGIDATRDEAGTDGAGDEAGTDGAEEAGPDGAGDEVAGTETGGTIGTVAFLPGADPDGLGKTGAVLEFAGRVPNGIVTD